MIRILLFGDGVWATNSLRRLAADGYDIGGVVIRAKPSDTTLVELAADLSVPVFQPPNVNSPEFVSQVRVNKPDLNLSVSYNQILHPPILRTAPLGFVNCHAGKLPNYRGRNVINWAIINGETEVGLTSHYVDEGIDTGEIILQRTLPIAWEDTYGDVLGEVVVAFPDLVAETVRLIVTDEVTGQPQAHLQGTYFSRRGEGDEWLDWSDTSLNIHNKVRAISRPGPGAMTLMAAKPVVIWRAFYDPAWPKYISTPGLVVGLRSGQGVLVKTGDSTLLVLEAQIGDGAPIAPTWRIGTSLGINTLSILHQLASGDTVNARLRGI